MKKVEGELVYALDWRLEIRVTVTDFRRIGIYQINPGRDEPDCVLLGARDATDLCQAIMRAADILNNEALEDNGEK